MTCPVKVGTGEGMAFTIETYNWPVEDKGWQPAAHSTTRKGAEGIKEGFTLHPRLDKHSVRVIEK